MTKYTQEEIALLPFSASVRRRPFTYVREGDAPYQMLWAILNNAVDESWRGHGATIVIELQADGRTVSVEDQGRGVPVDPVASRQGKSAVALVFASDPGQGGRRSERGLPLSLMNEEHGLHAAIVSALSQELVVETTRAGHRYRARFVQGEPVGDVEALGATQLVGTRVTFRPDTTLLGDDCRFDPREVALRLEAVRARFPTIEIVLRSSSE